MNIPELEKQILKKWNSINAFEKSVTKRPASRSFVFYEGPPTANGMPGFHHVEARSYKDVICRYKTMSGYRVQRRAGWDTHGLPVEIQVEKELGLKNKKDIEKYGIGRFNQKCRQSVWRYKGEWETLTERMGFWLDMKNPYITYDPLYMESLWNVIKQFHKKDLLYEGHRVTPRCMRCGTGLSSHEVAQGYKDIKEESVFVKFKVKNYRQHKLPANTFILAWTTTPWTLPGNAALAVGKNIKYALVNQGKENYIVASDLAQKVLEGNYKVQKELKGKDLEGAQYEPLFDALKNRPEKKHYVALADFVTTEDGTGIVHTSVMYGEDDYELGKKLNLPKVHTVDDSGKFNKLVPEFEGQNAKAADPAIIDYLQTKNLLYKTMLYEHSYPFCWRCDEPLLYYAQHSWFVAMGKLQKQLIEANKKINWVPAHLKEGRFGQWLVEVKDWAFSRSRYWGTPLPVWRCPECLHTEVIGSRDDLKKLTAGKNQYFAMRHGRALSNEKGILISKYPENKKHGLVDIGKKQAQKTAKEIAKNGGVDLIFSSPLSRTKETAEIVAKELGAKVKYDKRLLEVDGGIFNGKPIGQYVNYFKDDYEKFYKTPPKGENFAKMQHRLVGFVDELEKKYKDKKILLISHEAPIFVLRKALSGFTLDEAIEHDKKNHIETGSLHTLQYAKFPHNKEGDIDFHRPYIDKIKLNCYCCENENKMQRVEDLVDVWFDSGAMPFAQQHYPFDNKSAIDKGTAYPADYIAEAIDQTRGWFYTMLAVSAALDKAPSYKNVITLGIVLDEKGQKMSKSKGNIVNPIELADKFGMDAVRLYFFTVNGPAEAKRFSEKDVRDRLHKFVLTFANSLTFLKTYAPAVKPPKNLVAKNDLDIWITARLKQVARQVQENLEKYEVVSSARMLEDFAVEDLSNWYIRRSRNRLQRPQNKAELNEAAKTLAYILNEFSKICAPFTPFVAEHVWQELNNTRAKSVHWENYPNFKALTQKENNILKDMQLVRDWAQKGLRMRADKGIKVRQPLASFSVNKKINKNLAEILKEELNVKEIKQAKRTALDIKLTEPLRVEGYAREMVRNIQKLRKSLGLNPKDLVEVYYSLDESMRGKLYAWEDKIANDTNAKKILEHDIKDGKHDAHSHYKLDGKHEVQIAINKL